QMASPDRHAACSSRRGHLQTGSGNRQPACRARGLSADSDNNSLLTMQLPVSTLVVKTVIAAALRRPWPIFLALFCSIASAASAQSALTGVVVDPTGRVAVGATVTVLDSSETHQWETHVSGIGYYEIELPPGDYRVLVDF